MEVFAGEKSRRDLQIESITEQTTVERDMLEQHNMNLQS